MPDALSRKVDPWQAALAGKRLAGTLDASRLPRLSALAEPVGLLQVSLDFEPWQPAAGNRRTEAVRVVVEVRGRLRSTCQRCLEPVEFPADLDTAVMVAPDETVGGEADRVVVETGELLDTVALVEDEMLLGLPFAPAHAEGECAAEWPRTQGAQTQRPRSKSPQAQESGSGAAPPGAERRTDNPFAVLGVLKDRDRGDN